jgi:para-nitrobenzyl esterase
MSAVDGVRAFLTIPFAAPPTGENRWRPPQPHPGWAEPLDATEPGPSCPQPSEGATAQFTVIPESDEDCLTLNVWSPEDAAGLPVMVWIHGGGLSTGSAHQPYYIGDQLAARGVVLVSMNYRLGPFGFLATDELVAESEDGSYGNYGLADQVAALQWVQRNVAAFGGDPGNVTIFGESAGGFSVCGHLASPASKGLFHRAIIQSGGGCDRQLPGDAALAAGAEYLAATGCFDLACLRTLGVDELLAVDFDPVLVQDGVTLDTSALDLARQGDLGNIPVLTGANADEATLFTVGAPEPTDEELENLAARFTDDPAALLALYPAEEYPTNLARYQAMFTDAVFVCPALEFAAAAPTAFAYHYTYVSPSNPFGLGATHGAELASLFGHPEGIRGLDAELDETTQQLSDAIQTAWTEFAATGRPGADWPAYGDGGQVMLLDVPFTLTDQIRDGRCPALAELSS